MKDITDWLMVRDESIEFKRSDSKMNCTEKEQETCNAEKYGCEGCYYEDEEIKVGRNNETSNDKLYETRKK